MQTFTEVKESGKPRLLQSSWCLPVFPPPPATPNWSGNLNYSPIGGFAVQLNLTLSNHLPAAVRRCTGKYLWLPHTDAFGADCKFVLLSLFLLREVNSLSLLLDPTHEVLTVVNKHYTWFTLQYCAMNVYIGMKSFVERRWRSCIMIPCRN